MIYLVVGISGVGKSTVINRAMPQLNLKVVNWGDIMLEIAKKEYNISSRDKMKFLSQEDTRKLQMKTVEMIKAINGDVLVDTHLAIESPTGFLQGIPSWVARELKPVKLILIEAPPEDISKRRKKDTSKRQRFAESVDDISRHLDMDRGIAAAISYDLGIPIKIVTNINLDDAVSEFLEAFD